MNTIRILLVDDNRLLREGIAAMINGQPDMKVVAASSGGDSMVLNVRTVKPHLALIDLGLRNRNGLRMVALLAKEVPGLKVIGMGLIPAQSDIVAFVQAGASGFILKNSTVPNMLRTLRAVARGEKVLPPTLTHSLFSDVIEHALRKGKGTLNSAVRMTKRERETIALIAVGMSNREIAERLNIATYTVKSHVHNILEKLALHSRLQIAAHAHEERWP
jgi:two-component system nitrate/nitrite response regulator NarL